MTDDKKFAMRTGARNGAGRPHAHEARQPAVAPMNEARGDRPCSDVGRFWRNRAADLAANQGRTKPAEAGRDQHSRPEQHGPEQSVSGLGTAVVLCGFAFLALFSTSGAEKRAQERRTKPSLGRPETQHNRRAVRVDSSASQCRSRRGDQNSEQLSPDDILATSRRAQTANQQHSRRKTPDQYALNQCPPSMILRLKRTGSETTRLYSSAPAAARSPRGPAGLTTK